MQHVDPRMRLCVAALPGRSARQLRPLGFRPIGTNGYVSTWGAITSVCPPKDA
ncbi:hypothetical protein [[Actinomadura] parvosata]|uniref:hypothetical protein n=1 Tax=[Actinomadura] parvosata TaxID=1955412 RepID=UPI0012BD2564|nr:hypothetical protein [Nonomuraea sp. ATCC 55076]